MMKYLPLVFACSMTFSALAQEEPPKPFVVEGYAEVYYGYDIDRPANHDLTNFVVSHNRHNEVNANLAYLKGTYEKDRVRANVAIMEGTYTNAALALEPGVLKNIFEANIGVRLHKFRELWIDAGVFPSHIGSESAVSMNCATLTRSLVAEGTPYYETGVRLSYKSINQKWYLALLSLNGWQHIQRLPGNSTPAGGTQVTYTPNKKLLFNMSTFVGSDVPDSVRKMRYFADLYAVLNLGKRWQVTATLDLGMQQAAKRSNTYDRWFGTALIARYKMTPRATLVVRGERFYDPYYSVMPMPVVVGPGFALWGYSIGYDRQISKNAVWRIEAKGFAGDDPMFERGGALFNDDYIFTTSLAIKFNNLKNHR